MKGVLVCPLEGFPMSQSLAQLLLAYLPLIVFIGVAAVIGLALLVVAFVVAYKQPDSEKLSAYECGFTWSRSCSSFSILRSASCFRGQRRSANSASTVSGR